MGTLHSMTGFARADGSYEQLSWLWEIKSVNAKGLDVRVKVPAGLIELEQKARKVLTSAFTRGTLHASLTISQDGQSCAYQINQPWLDQLTVAAGEGASIAAVAALMQIEGVVTELDVASTIDDASAAQIMESLTQLCQTLQQARAQEGAALHDMLAANLETLDALNVKASAIAATQPKALKETLAARLTELLGQELDETRLIQEAALLALKADIREELDRIAAHVIQGRKLLAQGSPIGRKLDFLSQEFNREINTLCSKSADSMLTQIGMDLKSANEQFREQAANVE